MDKQTLLQRRQALTDQFNAKRAETDTLRQQVEAGESELVKLQGAYAEVENILNTWVEPTQPEVINVDPADVVAPPAKQEEQSAKRSKG